MPSSEAASAWSRLAEGPQWHTAGGPKVLYVVEGNLTVEGPGGQTLMACGPAPKLCFSPHKDLFFFRNAGQGLLKFVVIAMDPSAIPTNHEDVGQVVAIDGQRIRLALGDLRTSALSIPRQEIELTVAAASNVAVGDYVVTRRLNEKNHAAEGVVKLSQPWQ